MDLLTNSCTGKINNDDFIASMVQLTPKSFSPPRNESLEMFARIRGGAPNDKLKEIRLTFSKSMIGDLHHLLPETGLIRVTYTDYTDPANPLIYHQLSGSAFPQFDTASQMYTGTLTEVVVQNNDDDIPQELTLNIHFRAQEAAIEESIKRAA